MNNKYVVYTDAGMINGTPSAQRRGSFDNFYDAANFCKSLKLSEPNREHYIDEVYFYSGLNQGPIEVTIH